MKQLNQSIGGRPYWKGHNAPSTAFLTTEVAQLRVGHMTEVVELQEYKLLPDLFDVLVKIEAIPTSDNPTVTLNHKNISVFNGKLSAYKTALLSLIPQQVVRVEGIIKSVDFSQATISRYEFITLKTNIVLGESTDKLKLGGSWQPGMDLEEIKQYSVSFYEANGDIRYRLYAENSYVDYVGDGQILLMMPEPGERDSYGVYESIDIRRHGNYCAWITFRKRIKEAL